jgi:glycosyltransferase involved in cell wall biosynthesis
MAASKVAIQLISTGGVYGAERTLLELAAYLQAQGWQSYVIALEGKGATPLVERARASGLEAEAFVPTGRLAFSAMRARTRELLARHPRAVVHSHGYKPDILLSLLGAPRKLACVSTCHSWYRETLQLRILESIDKRVLRGFDHVVAVSGEIYSDLAAHRIAPNKLSLISNGISPPRTVLGARATVRREVGIPPNAPLVVQIGRLARSKRNDLLIGAAAHLAGRNAPQVLFVGEGDLSQALQAQVNSAGLSDRVHFLGYREDVAQILQAADVLALTSDKEGLPIVLLEAMALGCPIIATAVGEIPRVLRSGEYASLIPPDNLPALTDALREVLNAPAAARERAARAQAEFHRRFSQESMGKQYLEIYERAWRARGWVTN